MHTTKVFEELSKHHAQIIDQLAFARRLIREEGSSSLNRLSKERWRMAKMLRAYQLFKHVEIYDPLLKDSSQDVMVMANQLKSACTSLGRRFDQYTLRWSDGSVYSDQLSYVAAFETIAEDIELSLEAQLRGIRGMLSGFDRTRHN